MNDTLYREIVMTIDELVTDKFGQIQIQLVPINAWNIYFEFDRYFIGIFVHSSWYEIVFHETGYPKQIYTAKDEIDLFDTIEWLFDTQIGPPGDVF